MLSEDVVKTLKHSYLGLQMLGYALGPFKLTSCDGGVGIGIPFSSASCFIERYPPQNDVFIHYAFTEVFRVGADLLEKVIYDKENVDDDTLSVLLDFIADIKSKEICNFD